MDPKALSGRYAIAGLGEAGMGKAQPGDTALSLQCEAARQAILDAGLRPSDIDGVFAHWDGVGSIVSRASTTRCRPSWRGIRCAQW